MTSPRRSALPRTRRIRTDVRTGAPSLGRPLHDTGIDVRPRNRRSRRQSASTAPFAVTAVGLLLFGLLLGSLTSPDANPADGASNTAATASTATAGPQRDPTPLAATYKSLELRLPVDPSDITMVAFHQASGDVALHLVPTLTQIDAEALGEAISSGETASGVWAGTCVELWRSGRTGEPNTAIDVGADPGTEVYSPVTGVVVSVVAYKLYDKYDDYEIRIRPDGYDTVEVVLIHVDDVVVAAADTVTAGVTRIASVRGMSDKLVLQLAGYTTNGGDHVHVQLNSVEATGTGDGS